MNNLDSDALIKAGRMLQVPFALSVVTDDGETVDLTVREILRLLPGRRIVAIAEHQNQLLLVKVFCW